MLLAIIAGDLSCLKVGKEIVLPSKCIRFCVLRSYPPCSSSLMLRLDHLPEDVLFHVLALLELEDLLHLSRASGRLRTVVASRAEPVWSALYQSTFSSSVERPPDGITWAQYFRDR